MMRRVEKRKMKGEWAEQGSPRGRRGAAGASVEVQSKGQVLGAGQIRMEGVSYTVASRGDLEYQSRGG